jgi:hypothetical protein
MAYTPIHIAMKKAVDDLGTDILNSPMLVNILTDYHAFDVHDRDLQKRKRIIAEFVEKGFPNNLLRWKRYRSTYKDKCVGWINVNFNEDLLDALTATIVKDVACAFLFSLGLDTDLSLDTQHNADKSTLPNSLTKQILKAKSSTTDNENPQVVFNKLFVEYKSMCDNNVVVLGLKMNGQPDFGYKTKTIRQLDGYQKRLLKLCPNLNIPSDDLKDELKRFQKEAISAVSTTAQLNREKALQSGVIKRYQGSEPQNQWWSNDSTDKTNRNKTIIISIIVVIAIVLICLMIAFPEEFFAILIGVPLAYCWLFAGNGKKR